MSRLLATRLGGWHLPAREPQLVLTALVGCVNFRRDEPIRPQKEPIAMPAKLKPFYEDVQAHYDLCDDFYGLFLDPTRMYSCAYFRDDNMTLEEASLAKVHLSLGKCDLKPGQTLLDVGCGWGTTALIAAKEYGVNSLGLTLSKNQLAYASSRAAEIDASAPGATSATFKLQGWEEFSQPVDRIVSIGAFEHFRSERHVAFFEKCRSILPDDGRMMLHTIVLSSLKTIREQKIDVNAEDVAFGKFIRKEIFPGGQLCVPEQISELASTAGFALEHTQSLRLHYARTLECWAENLLAEKDEAIRLTSQAVYDRYIKYLTGCARLFRKGNIDVMQFVLVCK